MLACVATSWGVCMHVRTVVCLSFHKSVFMNGLFVFLLSNSVCLFNFFFVFNLRELILELFFTIF